MTAFMPLARFAVRGFQSYVAEQAVDIDRHITLLAGQNNVGKSALLRALRVPSLPQQGGAPDLALTWTWEMSHDAIVPSVFDDLADNSPASWLQSGPNPQPLITRHVRRNAGSVVDPAMMSCDLVRVPALHAAAQGAPGRSFGWVGGNFDNSTVAVDQLANLSWTAAANTIYLGPRRIDPSTRSLSPTSRLEGDARNLNEVLLWLTNNDPYGVFEEVKGVMARAFPGVRGVSVPSSQDQEAGGSYRGEAVVHFTNRPDPVPLRDCGTGLEQMLALAVAVLNIAEPRLVLIDEPQAYLHPRAEKAMLSLLEDHPHHQFVVASHSHVLLSGRPLSQARLMSLEEGATRIAQIADDHHALRALGVTPADLWLVDRLLWVEGPSEERVFSVLSEAALDHAGRATLGVHKMPEASRYVANAKQAAAITRFCEEAAAVISPVAVTMRFIFDADEKSAAFKRAISEASGGRALFLQMREMENYFLDPELLHARLVEITERSDQGSPSFETVQATFEGLLGEELDATMYPGGAPERTADRLRVVKASRLLELLWADIALAPYEKVRDGEALARLALRLGSSALDPLKAIVADVVAADP